MIFTLLLTSFLHLATAASKLPNFRGSLLENPPWVKDFYYLIEKIIK